MKYIADLHIHSKYSRGTSKDLNLENIDRWAKVKGIDIIGCGDFTHPAWFKELKTKLTEDEPGLYKLKGSNSPIRFLLTTEISCIYSKGGKVRRLHLIILAPNLTAVEKFNNTLEKRGAKLTSDGRPILGIDAKDLTRIALETDEKMMVIPAHAWTPWFAVFGSKSGFDSLDECFEELTPNIYAIETGLSSDPKMNWRLSALDKITLISNSDAHSLENLGREANVFDLDNLNYDQIYQTIKNKDKKKLLCTLEFFPEEGKYHLDGHAVCNVCLTPQETKKNNYICPQCQKKLTVGVLHRVDNLADREDGFTPQNSIPYRSFVPLKEIIADAVSKKKNTKLVDYYYFDLIKKAQNEFNVLLEYPLDVLKGIESKIIQGIERMRQGKVVISPGYDGIYGQVKIFSEREKQKIIQKKLI